MAALEEPKKAMTAYFIYLSECRPKLVQELGDDAKARGAVASLGAKKWKALSANERKPFEEKAATAKAKYEKALEAFKAAGGETGKRKADKKEKREQRAAKKARKESGQPKRPPSVYQVFANEVRPEVMASLGKGAGVPAIGKAIGERWKTVSAADKAKYQKVADEKNAAYKVELEAWKATKGNKENEEDEEKDDDEDEDEEE